jgi:hypothetical protein
MLPRAASSSAFPSRGGCLLPFASLRPFDTGPCGWMSGDIFPHELAQHLRRGLVLRAANLQKSVPEDTLDPDSKSHILRHGKQCSRWIHKRGGRKHARSTENPEPIRSGEAEAIRRSPQSACRSAHLPPAPYVDAVNRYQGGKCSGACGRNTPFRRCSRRGTP